MSVPLRKIIKVHYGKSLRSDERDDAGQYSVYGSSGEIGKHSAAFIEHPTIIIGRKGSVGAVTYAPTGGWAIDTTFYIEIINPNEVNLRYLYYALKTSNLARHTITTSIPGLNRDDIYRTAIFLPLINEQRRIAAVLDKADALREKRRQAINKLDTLLQAVFIDMFGDPVTNPKGWQTKRVDSFCTIVRGSSPRPKDDPKYYGGTIPRLMVADLTRDGWFVTPRIDSLTEEGAKLSRPVKAGTVVMAVSGNVGLTSILRVNACIHDGFVAFTDLDESLINPICLVLFLHYLKVTHETRKAGAIFQNLTTTDIKAMKLPIPPPPIQEKFNSFFGSFRAVKTMLEEAYKLNVNLFNSLQLRAFKGALFNGKMTAAVLPRKTVTTSQTELFD